MTLFFDLDLARLQKRADLLLQVRLYIREQEWLMKSSLPGSLVRERYACAVKRLKVTESRLAAGLPKHMRKTTGGCKDA